MSQKISGVKGMNDLLPPDIAVWHALEAAARETFRRFGYDEARTPVVEDTALFVRSVGEATDIVGKEMYTFQDKAGRSLSLRPEGTAPCVRAYIEHAVAQREPVTRWWYLGPMFRYERMKTGRYRQFWQVGAEAYGAKEPAQDVELIELAMRLLGELGLSDVRLHLNSLGDDSCRPAFEQKLKEYLVAHREALCADCQSRLERNPLRVLDCKQRGCRPNRSRMRGPMHAYYFSGAGGEDSVAAARRSSIRCASFSNSRAANRSACELFCRTSGTTSSLM